MKSSRPHHLGTLALACVMALDGLSASPGADAQSTPTGDGLRLSPKRYPWGPGWTQAQVQRRARKKRNQARTAALTNIEAVIDLLPSDSTQDVAVWANGSISGVWDGVALSSLTGVHIGAGANLTPRQT